MSDDEDSLRELRLLTKCTCHRMMPGSHERRGGPECLCGASWDRWNDRSGTRGEAVSDDEVIHMGWQEKAFATIRERLESENAVLRAELARTRPVVEAATALISECTENSEFMDDDEPQFSARDIRRRFAAVAALSATAPTVDEPTDVEPDEGDGERRFRWKFADDAVGERWSRWHQADAAEDDCGECCCGGGPDFDGEHQEPAERYEYGNLESGHSYCDPNLNGLYEVEFSYSPDGSVPADSTAGGEA